MITTKAREGGTKEHRVEQKWPIETYSVTYALGLSTLSDLSRIDVKDVCLRISNIVSTLLLSERICVQRYELLHNYHTSLLHWYSWQTGVQVLHSCHTSLLHCYSWQTGVQVQHSCHTSLLHCYSWQTDVQVQHSCHTSLLQLVFRSCTAATLHYFTATAGRLVSSSNTAATHNCSTLTSHLGETMFQTLLV